MAILILLEAALGALAQGTVNFNNNVPFSTAGNRLVIDISGFPLVGTNWVAQLYYGAPAAAEGSLVPVAAAPAHFRVPTTSQPGTWSGGSRVLDGFVPGDTVTLQVRYWDFSLYPSYSVALAAGGAYGKSLLFAYTIPASAPPPQPSAFFMEGFRAIEMIPEPATMVLGLLGLALLLAVRRR